jgi:hypothetical protein
MGYHSILNDTEWLHVGCWRCLPGGFFADWSLVLVALNNVNDRCVELLNKTIPSVY